MNGRQLDSIVQRQIENDLRRLLRLLLRNADSRGDEQAQLMFDVLGKVAELLYARAQEAAQLGGVKKRQPV